MLTRFAGFMIVSLLSFASLGCWSGAPDDLPDLGSVEGMVTLDGQPLKNADVTFQGPDGRLASGTTDESGHYELTILNDTRGAVVGENKVFITTGRSAVDDSKPETARPETLPAKYHKDSTETRTVAEGANTFDFVLESK
ncbi:MAG: carboxypeptidase regulatory-like domain-containing protein [Rubinisphaera brasiliensis]|uniref:carboxypeptidase regulatory-like domain-containing protein n=1 Tax=Rubinisphaera brasiliensis TaxID=119 RepID=UPI00391B8F89